MASAAERALATYRRKRDFSKTGEPSGGCPTRASPRLRFVVQKHEARRLHFDLRLELGGVFKSWAVTRGPSDDPADKRLAVEVEDHPLEYGDFEGVIPAAQYGGGTVQIWDRGYWTPQGERSPEEALSAGELKFSLHGRRLHGAWVLVRMRRDRGGGAGPHWLLIKHRDAAARADGGAALLAADRSVASGRTMREIAAGTGRAPRPFMRTAAAAAPGRRRASLPPMAARIPDFVAPQLCRPAAAPPSTSGWGHEVKFDGYRLELRVVGGAAVLRTRHALDWTSRFAPIVREARALPDCLIDGEVVALDSHGVPSFSALQAALAAGRPDDLVFFAFDLPFEGRRDLRHLPLAERKARLERLLDAARRSGGAGRHIRYVRHLESPGGAVLESARRLGLEGIVSKRLSAPYASGRSDAWRKIKCRPGQEVVIGGWMGEGGNLRSLLAGVYRGDDLAYVGRIGTGYDRRTVRALLPRLRALAVEASPFAGATGGRRDVHWLRPQLVAEIEFAGWTPAGMLREAAFKGLREDKTAGEVVEELVLPAGASTERRAPRAGAGRARVGRARAVRSPARPHERHRSAAAGRSSVSRSAAPASTVMGVAISKPDKPLWPDAGDGRPVTKLDLARYFESIGAWMLPHLEGRPCSLVRAPDGIGGEQFFQRHAMPGMSGLFALVKVKGDRAPYVQIDRVEALAAVAQLGALELHPWNCVPHAVELAGRLVFDLDPAPDLPFAAVIAAAQELHERLRAVGLESFCKTTGGKGLHVVVPLSQDRAQAVDWPAAKNFAHLVCAQMAQDSPRKYLDTMSKSRRTGRIFLDYLRNDRTATAVAPLSPRARAGAPVSMPLTWRQVGNGLDPKDFTVRTAPALLKKSRAWGEYSNAARPLGRAIRRITGA